MVRRLKDTSGEIETIADVTIPFLEPRMEVGEKSSAISRNSPSESDSPKATGFSLLL